MLFGGSGRPVPAARSSRLCPHAWGFADEWALSGTRRAMLARGRSVWTGLEGQLTPLGHRGYARMRGGFAVEWTLSGVRKAPLARGRGLFGRDGKGGPAFLSGRAILSEVSLGSCGGRGLSEHDREWGFGGRIRMRSGVGGMSAIGLESLPDASARAPGSGHVGNKVGELARRICTRSGGGGMSAIGLGSCPAHPHALRGRMYRKTATAR